VNAQYDTWGNTGRMIDPMAVPSPLLRDPLDEQGIVDSILGDNIADLFEVNEQKVAEVPEGGSARDVIAEFMRRQHSQRFKRDYARFSNTEMIDAYQYYVFPNVQPWAGQMFPELYRTMPNGTDPETSIFEVRLLFPVPPGEDRPKDVPLHQLEPDEPWSNAKEMGELGPVIDQDLNNLAKVQLGLHSDGITAVNFSRYQEGNIRRMHRRIDELIAAGRAAGNGK
jgi:Ring hydroxylating alpha subunit (catalytic domain)